MFIAIHDYIWLLKEDIISTELVVFQIQMLKNYTTYRWNAVLSNSIA